MITYKKGSLFEALTSDQKDVVLAHACNCRGVWGSGIAVEFKARYPEVFAEYNAICREKGDSLLGNFTEHTAANGDVILCLYTSRGYGDSVDPAGVILGSTRESLQKYREHKAEANVHMPKINSGRFSVPWNFSEGILNELLHSAGIMNENLRYTVWEP
jgi:ADP-ribose 1''-phosphate phosphatase